MRLLLGTVPYERAHEVYRRAEVFVSPTYAEGFSNTILEAMASGLPVVSTNVVGVRDCVRPDDGLRRLAIAEAARTGSDAPSAVFTLATGLGVVR